MNQLRYPLDLLHEGSDYFQIEVIKYKPHKGSGDDNLLSDGMFKNVTQISKAVGSDTEKWPVTDGIILPIPQDIKDSNGVQWGEDRLNDYSAKIFDLANSIASTNKLKDIPSTISNKFKETDEQLAKGVGSRVVDYMKTVAVISGANAFGANVSLKGILGRSKGQVINQNVELLFGGVQTRGFNFAFPLAPRSQPEAKEVKDIIRLLKTKSAAKLTQTSGGFLNSPDIFRIAYMQGGSKHPFLNSFKACALTNMSVNYTASGTYATLPDGEPVHMVLNLSFKELNPIYAEDYAETAGVGY